MKSLLILRQHLNLHWTDMWGDSAIPRLRLSIPIDQCRMPIHPQIIKDLFCAAKCFASKSNYRLFLLNCQYLNYQVTQPEQLKQATDYQLPGSFTIASSPFAIFSRSLLSHQTNEHQVPQLEFLA
jgi:hypothetical protein